MIVPEVFLSVMVFCRHLRLLQNAVFSKDDQEFFIIQTLKLFRIDLKISQAARRPVP